MSVGGFLFWAFIGMPIALTVLWWVFLLIAMVLHGIGVAFKKLVD